MQFGYFIFNIRVKEVKKAGHNKKLDEITSRFPENKEICEEVLKKLNNTKVKIKVENETETESSKEKRKDSIHKNSNNMPRVFTFSSAKKITISEFYIFQYLHFIFFAK